MAENIKAGSYVIASFHSERSVYILTRDTRQSYQHIFRIRPGEMHYLGSFNLHVTRRGKISYGDLKISELQRPGEREILMRLYDATDWHCQAGQNLTTSVRTSAVIL